MRSKISYLIRGTNDSPRRPATARAENVDRANEWRNGVYHQEYWDTVDVVLSGVADYEVTEIFNDILARTPGVVEARRIQKDL